jgi:microcystin-dependent protein
MAQGRLLTYISFFPPQSLSKDSADLIKNIMKKYFWLRDKKNFMKHRVILYILLISFAVICAVQPGSAQVKNAVRDPLTSSMQGLPQKNYAALGLNFIIAIQGSNADPNITIGMGEPMLGEIKLIAGEVAPKGWALCKGQLMLIQYNAPLFSILGNRFGGDGKVTFALPNLKDTVPIGAGEVWQPGNRSN